MVFSKVHIIGPMGCGKSTFAKAFSKKYKLSYLDLDDVYFKRKYDIQRDDEEKLTLVHTFISNHTKWIVEGVPSQCATASFKKADIIIWLQINSFLLCYRILKRHLFEQPFSFKELRVGLRFSGHVLMYRRGNWLFRRHQKRLAPYMHKVIIVHSNEKMEELLQG